MGNMNPSPATRFKPGQPKPPNAGRKIGTPNRATILQRAPKIRSLDEIKADPNAFRGSMAELLEAVARDDGQPLDVRLACANSVARLEGASSKDNDLTLKSEEELLPASPLR